jgi:hypothetical protein
MQLDLGNKGGLSIEDSILIDKIAPEVQNEYNKLVENLISDNALCRLDLLLSVVSRNPHHSSILSTLCKVLLLEKKLKRGDDISLIIIESPILIPTINSVLDKFNQKIPVRVRHKFPHILLIFFSGIKFIKSIYLIIISWLWPRLTKSYKIQPKESILFIDSFILPGSFTKEGDFVDRYYTGYDQNLNNAQRKKIWYSPTLFGLKTLGQCLKMSIQAKKSKHNFIFQESWLTLYDYIYAFCLTIVVPFKVKNSPLFMGHNIHQLLINEARKDILSPSLTMAICKYRFIKNLRKAGIEICHVVDWHENQTIDKALNLGFHKYYPDVIVKGYQGHVSPSYDTHKVPQSYEIENGTLPNQLYVISKNYKKTILNNCPDLDVRVASAFRYSYLYDINRRRSTSDIPTILIALPMDIDESTNILNMCGQLQSLIDTKVSILVKHHPAHESHIFAKRVPLFFNDSFIQTNDSMSDLLKSISLVISSASSACAEAASLGIPVAMYGNRYGVTMNTILDGVNGFSNNIFYSESQLAEFIKLYLGKNGKNSSIDQTFFMDNGESVQALFVCE